MQTISVKFKKIHNMEQITNNKNTYKYYAFISYKSDNEKWAKWLQNKLEKYRLPIAICRKHKSLVRKLNPCFRYHTDIGIDILKKELHKDLLKSQYLIVVCSTKSAKSEWVGEEIRTFIDLGRQDKIIPFIVEGDPYSNDENECYHHILKQYFPRTSSQENNHEILGANINEEGKGSSRTKRHKAFIKILAKLHNLEFDELWRRDKRRRVRNIIVSLLLGLVILFSMSFVIQKNQPKDVTISLNEISFHNKNLPPLNNAEIILYLDNDIRKDTVISLEDKALFPNIPAKYIGKQVKISFSCEDYIAFDTSITLQKSQQLNIQRDETMYGIVKIRLFSDEDYEKPLANTTLYIKNSEYKTDNDGLLYCKIPLQEQDTTYTIRIKKYGNGTIIYPYRESTSVPLVYVEQ